ncbi:hypothetical protein Tco_1073165 [Tanacetum coccineum]
MIAMDFLLVRYVEHRTLCQLCGKWTNGREQEFLASATSTGAGDDDTLDLYCDKVCVDMVCCYFIVTHISQSISHLPNAMSNEVFARGQASISSSLGLPIPIDSIS